MGPLRAGRGLRSPMKTGPFSLPGATARYRLCLSDFFGDGKELINVAVDRGCEVIVGSGDADAVERSMVAGHVLFGEAGDALPAYGVALAGEGGAPDESEVDVEAPAFGEVYEDVEGAGDAFAVASEVAGPGFLNPAAPGGVVAQLDEGGVAWVALVEFESAFV